MKDYNDDGKIDIFDELLEYELTKKEKKCDYYEDDDYLDDNYLDDDRLDDDYDDDFCDDFEVDDFYDDFED